MPRTWCWATLAPWRHCAVCPALGDLVYEALHHALDLVLGDARAAPCFRPSALSAPHRVHLPRQPPRFTRQRAQFKQNSDLSESDRSGFCLNSGPPSNVTCRSAWTR